MNALRWTIEYSYYLCLTFTLLDRIFLFSFLASCVKCIESTLHYRFKSNTYLRSQYVPYSVPAHGILCLSDCTVNCNQLVQFYELKFRILFQFAEFNFWFRSVDEIMANGWVRRRPNITKNEFIESDRHITGQNLFQFICQLAGYFTRPSYRAGWSDVCIH